jgi:hypothetical protein
MYTPLNGWKHCGAASTMPGARSSAPKITAIDRLILIVFSLPLLSLVDPDGPGGVTILLSDTAGVKMKGFAV